MTISPDLPLADLARDACNRSGNPGTAVPEGKKRVRPAAILLVALLVLTGCRESFSWRQKMTVTVSTPSGEVSGASVTEVKWTPHLIKSEGMGWHFQLRGEAVVVEVAPDQYLIALLKGGVNEEYMGTVAATVAEGRKKRRVLNPDAFRAIQEKVGLAASPMVVPVNHYPILISYGDLSEPETVRTANPTNLAEVFGPGFALKSVILEITDEPVTIGNVAALLPCLNAGLDCIPRDLDRPYGDPLRSTPNHFFVSE